ncbi:MAG: hypothetical protein LBL20_07760 [Treponema sp.]|nr:hypothetical protein [Treponema sp.]
MKLDGPGLPGFHDPAALAKRDPGLSGREAPAAGKAGLAAADPVPPAAARAKPPALSLEQLARSLDLPKDDLSSALIGFARIFSLPLKPALFARLRREALALKARQTGGSTETPALAAAAAAGKGVALGKEALEQYARAIDPEYAAEDPRNDGEERPAGEEGAPFGEGAGDAPEERRDRPGGEDSARVIREILEKALKRVREGGGTEESGDESPASFLNRLPGRDGNFWIVYPFKINHKELAIRLSVWILLLSRLCFKEGFSGQSAGNPVGGITINAAGGERRWIFSIKNPGGSGARTRVSVSPPYGEAARKRTEEEIREVLGGFGGEVTLESGEAALVSGMREGDAFSSWPLFFTDAGLSPVEEEA